MDIVFLEQLKEIRQLFPEFGYCGKAGWLDEDDNPVDWDEE